LGLSSTKEAWMFVHSRRGFLQASLAAPVLAAGTGVSLAAPWIPKTVDQWKARWIWDDYNRETTNIYVCLRKRVVLDAAVRNADVWCTANSFYRLFVNGQQVGMGPEPNEPPWKYYDYYRLAGSWRAGENAIAALCYNLGIGTHFYGAGPGGFLLQAALELENGKQLEIVTDGSWQAAVPRWYSRYAPQMLWASGFQETIDLRKQVPDWTTSFAETKDIRWGWAAEYGNAPYLGMLPREVPYQRQRVFTPARVIYAKSGELPADWAVQQAETMSNPNPNIITRMSLSVETDLPAGAVSGPQNLLVDTPAVTTLMPREPGKSTRLLVDFGEELVGYPQLDIAEMNGGVLDLGYSEFLKKGDQIDLLRAVLQADRIILAQGARRWESYDRRAFRYLLLEAQGLKGPLKLRHLRMLRTAYPVAYAGRFESSDALLDRIWEACRRSTELNMHDHYEDGPVRERGQYAGDIRTTALWNYYFFGDRLLIAKGLRHFARIQDPSGWFKTLSPSGTRHNIVEMMMQWVITIWEYYWYTGDAGLARDLAPHAYRALRWFEQYREPDGLIGKADSRDWWVFIDWGTFDFRDEVAGVNLWYFQALETAVKLARLRGDETEAGHFANLARAVAAGIERRFWNPKEDAYVDCWTPSGPSSRITRQTNYLAVLSGLAPRERWAGIVDRVTRKDTERIQTPYFKYFELACWLLAGRPLKSVLDEIRAWWGEQIKRGATTFWEVFDDTSAPDSVPEGTCCHSWTGGPAVLLGQEILGVKPLEPGFRKVLIRPHWADFRFVRGAVPTPQGPIEIRWDGARRWSFKIPPCQATVGVPAGPVRLDGRTVTGRREADGYLYFDVTQGGEHVVESGPVSPAGSGR
jgi:hypothetical protein